MVLFFSVLQEFKTLDSELAATVSSQINERAVPSSENYPLPKQKRK